MSNTYKFSLIIIFCLFCIEAQSQQTTESSIKARAEVHSDKILLRWVPSNAKAWELLNKHGVCLERLTISRAGVVLAEPEVKLLSSELKPRETQELKDLVTKYQVGAIVAQAIFGEDFEVDMGQSPISKAIALDEIRQQRYLFSLYAADLCFPVAKEVGWGWEDKDFKTDERYLYKITPNYQDKNFYIQQGAIFVVANQITEHPSPIGLSAQFSESGALLSWDYNILSSLYSAYIIEKSTNGKTFVPISDLPVTNLSNRNTNAPISYLDTIPLGTKVYYRVAGITPFGSKGEYSEIISGTAYPQLKSIPMITKTLFDTSGGAHIYWQFNENEQDKIIGFNILHSTNSKNYTPLVENINPDNRSYHIQHIGKHIYYKIEAKAKYGNSVQSLPVLIQPIDSIPPSAPKGLKAKIDTLGAVHLRWQPNRESDIYGYRLYRGLAKGEELIPITDIAIRDTYYIDTVDIRNLNNKVYYSLTALDERYNQSEQCNIIEVLKPNVIPPTAPIITKVKAEQEKNIIEWVSGEDPYLAGFTIMRKAEQEEQFKQIASINNTNAQSYQDTDILGETTYQYQVIAFSTGKLNSPASNSYRVKSLPSNKTVSSIKFNLEIIPSGISIKWNTSNKQTLAVYLYKVDKNGTLFLYRENLPAKGELVDTEIMQKQDNEYMLVVKNKGVKPITIKKNIKL